MTTNAQETVERLTAFFSKKPPAEVVEEPPAEFVEKPKAAVSEISTTPFDIREYLPEGITTEMNGRLPAEKLKRIHCGGELYIDAARAWLAMVRAAVQDGVFLNLNFAVDAYKTIGAQIKRFKQRFEETDAATVDPNAARLQVEFNGKIYQLKDGQKYTDIPGQSPHGYGLMVWIRNAKEPEVQNWLNENAEQFGFVKYGAGPRGYAYVKAREEIPPRVLEVESWQSESEFTAGQIAEASGCEWINKPPKEWRCHGLFYEEPFKPGYLVVVNQGTGFGIDKKLLKFTYNQCAGIICTKAEPFLEYNCPLLVTTNVRETVEKLNAFFAEKQAADELAREIPTPLFDIREYLPEGITPALNGILHPTKLRKIHCGGELYIDAARAWLAMVRAAVQDGVFLNLNIGVDAYRTIGAQIKRFKRRFDEIEAKEVNPNAARLQVEFNGKIYQLKDGQNYTDIPGQSSHGYGLSVWIRNATDEDVNAWLEENAEQFGFVREFESNIREYTYIKAREEIPPRVLEIENLPPEPEYTAEQVAEISGGIWLEPPPEEWRCHGLFYTEPLRAGYLVVVDQGLGFGIDKKLLKFTYKQFAGIICSDPEPFLEYNCPLLVTLNPQEAAEKLEEFFVESQAADKVDDSLQTELEFYKRLHPETVIFQKKKNMAERLLKIKVEDLQFASEKSWYGEYLALLPIHIEDPALRSMGKQFVKDLMRWYNEHIEQDERELAVLGILQFIKPQELTLPFNKHLFSHEMCLDIRGVFANFYTRINYSDYDLAAYYLSKQSKWRHKRRKMRVAFLITSIATAFDKMVPVYEMFKNRSDVRTFLIIITGQKEVIIKNQGKSEKHNDNVWKHFLEKYPDTTIYQDGTLSNLRDLKPDYVFMSTPHLNHCNTGFHFYDTVSFAKICFITYGANLSYTITMNLFEVFPEFFKHIYFAFCSCASSVRLAKEAFSHNSNIDFQHFEFLGYPILEKYYRMPATESLAKRILWTPRWSNKGRNGGSHFLEYMNPFVALYEKYGHKISLNMRPHPLTFDYILDINLMTEEEILDYKNKLKEYRIKVFDGREVDIDENIKETDIFLADYSSMLIVLFLTERPIIYCEFPNADPLPEYQEMFNAMYIARSWEDVEHYLDDLIKGEDPLLAKRQEVAKQIYETHKNATQKIVDRVVQDWQESQIDDEDELLTE